MNLIYRLLIDYVFRHKFKFLIQDVLSDTSLKLGTLPKDGSNKTD